MALNAMRPFVKARRWDRLLEVARNRCVNSVEVAFENVGDAGNGAALVRTVESFGVHRVHLLQRYARFNHDISTRSDRWLSFQEHQHAWQLLEYASREGAVLVATTPAEDAQDIVDVDWEAYKGRKLICVLGNEARGCSPLVLEAARLKVNVLPARGLTRSLNVSVACGIMLAHLREAGLLAPDASPEQVDEILTRFLMRDLGTHAAAILEKAGVRPKDY